METKSSILQNSTSLIALITVFLLSLFKLAEYDTWWIMAGGRYVLEHMTIPHTDVFRFVSIDKEYPWTNHLYLTGSIFYLVFILGGYGGLVLFKAVVITSSFAVFLNTLKSINKENICFALALLLLSVFAIRFRLVERPDIFSFLFFVIVYRIMERFRGNDRAPLYLLPIITIIWTNLHAGYFAGLIVLVTVLVAEIAKFFLRFDQAKRMDKKSIGKLSIWTLTSFAAVAINPIGLKMYDQIIGTVVGHQQISASVGTARVGEWQSLALHHFKGLGICYTSEYGIILILLLLSVLMTIRKIDITDMALAIGFFYASTVSIRFIPFAVFVMVPIIYRNYDYAGKRQGLRVVLFAVAVFGISLGVMGLRTYPNFKFGTGIAEGKFPEGAVKFIKDNNVDGNFFNTYGIGGYLIWNFYPERRVFMDGRVLDNIGDYYKMVDSPDAWRELEKQYAFDVVILENDRKDFVGHLYANPDWSLVFWDDRGLVFLKNIPKYSALIEKEKYRLVKPFFYDFAYMDHELKSYEKKMLAIRELQRNISSTTRNSEARLALAYIYEGLGKSYYNAAFEEIQKALLVAPHLSMAHSALGWLYFQKGEKTDGMRELKEALRLDPYDPLAVEMMKNIKGKRG